MAGIDGINLNRLVVFAAVVEAGSLTQAASHLGLGKTVVSSHLQELERELGVTLLVRNTRRMSLTEHGEQFYLSVQNLLQGAREAIETLSAGARPARGTLRISAPVDYSAYVLAPLLVGLKVNSPELNIELHNDDHCLDLISAKLDAVIRLSDLKDSNLKAVQIDSFRLLLVASPAFLARYAALEHPREIECLPHIMFTVFSPFILTVHHPQEHEYKIRFGPGMSVNTAFMAKAMALAGGGIAVVPDFSAREDLRSGRLVQVLPQWTTASRGIHVVYPRTTHVPGKLRTFIDHLKSALSLPETPVQVQKKYQVAKLDELEKASG